MRGAPDPMVCLRFVMGIIPADAGSTDTSVGPCLITEDHPRGCGEHDFDSLNISPAFGSSPRMRGAHTPFVELFGQLGIIPADAGSTLHTGECQQGETDHPRGCGEHARTIHRSW